MTALTPKRALLLSSPMLLAIVLLVGAELMLPGMAEDRVRDDLRASGTVTRVSVSARPALKLLWGRADSVEVELREVRAAPGEIGDLVDRTRPADEVRADVATMSVGPLRLRDVVLRKDGENLRASANVRSSDLEDLPAGVQVRPVGTQDGSLLFEGSAELFGVRASARARLSVADGDLVVAPEEGIPFLSGLARFTVFSDDRVVVRTVGAEEATAGFTVSATGRLGRTGG